MSQLPKCKGVSVVSGTESRRGSLPKTTNKPPAAQENELTNNSKSKNKIPKKIRYDLQNALVSLCDVWFEEIKPHLLRNNIKLHTHEQKPRASGDFKKLPPEASGCSHLDPGAALDYYRRRNVNFADYCSTQPTASRAQCLKPQAVSRCPDLPPLLSLSTNPQISSRSSNSKRKPRRQSRARRRCRPQQTASYQRVPRLCHTYSSQWPSMRPREVGYHDPRLNRNISYTLLPTSPSPQRKHVKHKSTQTDFPFCNCKEASIPTANQPIPQIKKRRDSSLSSPLFQEDVIDIICGKRDKQINILYKNPARDICSSIDDYSFAPPKVRNVKKNPPWR